MRLTIAARLVGVGIVGVLSVGAVATAAIDATSNQRAATSRMASVSQGMSEQWNADMMHDGIRADVMAALVAGNDADRETFGTAEVADHAQLMKDKVAAAQALAPAALQEQFSAVRPRVDAYGTMAT